MASFNFNSFSQTIPFEQLFERQEQPRYTQTAHDLLSLGSLNLRGRRVTEIRSTTTILTPNRVVVQTVLDLADPQGWPNQFHGQSLVPVRAGLGQLWAANQYCRQHLAPVLGQPWEANQFNGQVLAPMRVGQGQLREVNQFHGVPLSPSRIAQGRLGLEQLQEASQFGGQFHGQRSSPKRLGLDQLREANQFGGQFHGQPSIPERLGLGQLREANQFHGQSSIPERLGLSQLREANQFHGQPLATRRLDLGQLQKANQFGDQPLAIAMVDEGQQWEPIPPSGVRPIILSDHPIEEGDMIMDDGQIHSLETGRDGVYECPLCRIDFFSSQSFASHAKVIHYANETPLEKKMRLHAKYMAKIMKRRWKLLRPWMFVRTRRTRLTRRKASVNVDPDLSSLKIERDQQ